MKFLAACQIRNVLRKNRLSVVLGAVLFYLTYVILSLAIPEAVFRGSVQVIYANPLTLFDELGWRLSVQILNIFFNQSILAFWGQTSDDTRWQLYLSLSKLLYHFPIALLTGIYTAVVRNHQKTSETSPGRRSFTTTFGLYMGPFAAAIASALNLTVWIGCCGDLIDRTLIGLFGLAAWMAPVVYLMTIAGIVLVIIGLAKKSLET